MRLLVCGGRDYDRYDVVNEVLNTVNRKHDIEFLIHGGADGADYLAGEWAKENGVSVLIFPANWQKHGRAAGPIRNQLMLDVGKPTAAVAFPGSRGTADMVRRAKELLIPVWEVRSDL